MRLFSFRAFSYHAHFHSTPSLITPIFIPAFSYDTYFHSPPSPTTLIFIPRLLLRHLFSFAAFSYGAYYQSPPTPIALVRIILPPPLSGLAPPPPTPRTFMPRQGRWPLGLFSFPVFSYRAYFHYTRSLTAPVFILRLLLMRRFSLRAFSYVAYFHYTSSPMTLTFIIHHLLWRILSFRAFSYGVERKWHFKKFLRDPKC